MMGVCLPHSTYAPSNAPREAQVSGLYQAFEGTQEGVDGWQVLVTMKIGGFEVDFLSLALKFAPLNFSIESQLKHWIISAETCTDIHKDLGTVGLNVLHSSSSSVINTLVESKPQVPHIFSFTYGQEKQFIIGGTQPNLEFTYIDVVAVTVVRSLSQPLFLL
jgi:hypothetical protein